MIRAVLALALTVGAFDPAHGAPKGDKKPPVAEYQPATPVRTTRLCKDWKPCPCWTLWQERIGAWC